jgi:hypothetical protein
VLWLDCSRWCSHCRSCRLRLAAITAARSASSVNVAPGFMCAYFKISECQVRDLLLT